METEGVVSLVLFPAILVCGVCCCMSCLNLVLFLQEEEGVQGECVVLVLLIQAIRCCLVYVQTFAFDHCFWTVDPNNPKYAGEFIADACTSVCHTSTCHTSYSASQLCPCTSSTKRPAACH